MQKTQFSSADLFLYEKHKKAFGFPKLYWSCNYANLVLLLR